MHQPSRLVAVVIPHLEQHTKLVIVAPGRETLWNEKGTACTGRPCFELASAPVIWKTVTAAWTRGARAYSLQTVCAALV